MRQIVGAQVGNMITNRLQDIIQGARKGTIQRLLSKQEMQLMARFDLGEQWEAMARSPVLFLYCDKTGKMLCPDSPPETEEK